MNTTPISRLARLALLAGALLAGGCPTARTESSRSSAQDQPSTPAAPLVIGSPSERSASTAHGAAAHDPAHPPIDCPLRKQGIDPTHLRPFADVEKYIAFLERPDRASWQKPDQVVAALGLGGSETVVDLGAGSGYFAFRLAKVLPRGRVVASDTEAEMIRHIHHKAMMAGVGNIQVALIQADDPAIPPDTDLVFVCDVLHHVANRAAWLHKIAAALRPGARLVLIEFKEGELPEGPPASVKIPRDRLVGLVGKAGLVLAYERAELLPYQTFLVFQKP